MKIMLVDDSMFARRKIRSVLAEAMQEPWDVVEADSGETAVEMYAREQPDICFLDYLLPGINGEEVFSRIRSQVPRDAVVVILTSNAQKTIRDRLLAAGADMFFEKVINREKIVEVLELWQRKKSAAAAGSAPG